MENYIYKGYGKTISLEQLQKPLSRVKKISILIPTFNEEENIEKIVESIKEIMSKTDLKNSYEIIVVDDNSSDKTPQIIDKLSKKKDFIAFHRYNKRGLFSAIDDGVKISNGDYILTLDADFSHPPDLIPRFLDNYQNHNIIYGSRYIRGGGMNAPFIRKYGSIILNNLCIFIAGLNVSDFGGQFRLIEKEEYSKIKFKHDSKFAEYGIELFYRAKKKKLKMRAVPFVYNFRKKGESKMGNLSKLPKLGILYIKTAFKLRFENFIKSF